jgi:uncharacterized membrane protein YhaH (DUF805 family)
MEWYLKVMKENFSNFSGRARRKEFWMWYLFYVIVLIVAMILDGVLGTGFEISYGVTTPYGWIYIIAAVAHVIPGLAVSVRRLHDVGKSGWFMFISLIPIIGGIWLLVLMCTDGDSSENAYGPSPKLVE